MTVRFAKLTREEHEASEKIARRFLALGFLALTDLPSFTPLDIVMDLSAVHAHTPLRLEELAEADDFNLAHDVCGIQRHLDRRTGKLGGCFVPRYAVPAGRRP
jgi:hypothetical protein